MIGKGERDVKHELSPRSLRHKCRRYNNLSDCFALRTGLMQGWIQRPIAPAARLRAGVTLIAMRSLTVLQICSHMPHPTHRS